MMQETAEMVDGLVVLGGTHVVLIRRAKPPFMDKLVLPGGHVESTDASRRDACVREIFEEIGLSVSAASLSPLCVLDAPGRDPRKQTRSTVFVAEGPLEWYPSCAAGSDAESLVLAPLASLTPRDVGFDHWNAISMYRDRLRTLP